ncbi:MAG: glycosyltransferase family 2 protein [Candidatus Pacebacteria bacterium CG_4_10_14_0_8_um_filter_42_14]|nr:MAG: dolichyl-phosphate mannose synthase [Candidatus Omnitrophica bacterium CG11_big_fil_rev_8_21_14_0_20_41_12]PIY79949.1 MAG: glycosyltransferase family 2 protein [Candidatus Pacebacteria bacterium CG_4_10_14_0_8_um_filter_42_14]
MIMRTCVVIPAYNESKAIAGLIAEITKLGLEIIIVDDGSSDNTVQIAQASKAKVIRNDTNMGKGASLIKGYNFAIAQGFDAVISMDGDGQHSCNDIMSFIHKAENSQAALIIGNRMSSTKKMPLLRVLTNRFMSRLISLITKQFIPDTQCGFRLIKKELLEKIVLSTSKYEIESEVLIKAARLGFKIESIPVRTIYSGQKSQINPFIDTLRFLRFIIKESIRPIKHA